MNNASSLKILDGAEVYWTEIRRFNVNRKSSKRQETIVVAGVVGIKHCPYICNGSSIFCSIFSRENLDGGEGKIYARPINPKLPIIQLETPYFPTLSEKWDTIYDPTFYYWAKINCWNSDEEYPRGELVGVFDKMKSAESEAEAILYSMELNQTEIMVKNECNFSGQ